MSVLSSPLQVLIPISLYVSIELVKIGQIFFITNDLDLYDEETDSRMQCKALNITEDLGQIEYMFSDKTGTLTENKMVFRRCSIMGTEYSHKENGKPSHKMFYIYTCTTGLIGTTSNYIHLSFSFFIFGEWMFHDHTVPEVPREWNTISCVLSWSEA